MNEGSDDENEPKENIGNDKDEEETNHQILMHVINGMRAKGYKTIRVNFFQK